MKLFLISLIGLVATGLCPADTIYQISLQTSPLQGNLNGPFALDFQLTSGDTTSGVVNSAALSQFEFGTAGAAGAGSPFSNSGNAAGSFSSTVTLTTSGGIFFNEFSQDFTPGDTLRFQLDLTNNTQPTPTPDEFTFQLIDGTGNEVATTDPSGSDSLLVIDLTGVTLDPQLYITNGDGVSISPRLISAVPEPASEPMLSAMILIIALERWRSERKSGQKRTALRNLIVNRGSQSKTSG